MLWSGFSCSQTGRLFQLVVSWYGEQRFVQGLLGDLQQFGFVHDYFPIKSFGESFLNKQSIGRGASPVRNDD